MWVQNCLQRTVNSIQYNSMDLSLAGSLRALTKVVLQLMASLPVNVCLFIRLHLGPIEACLKMACALCQAHLYFKNKSLHSYSHYC